MIKIAFFTYIIQSKSSLDSAVRKKIAFSGYVIIFFCSDTLDGKILIKEYSLSDNVLTYFFNHELNKSITLFLFHHGIIVIIYF